MRLKMAVSKRRRRGLFTHKGDTWTADLYTAMLPRQFTWCLWTTWYKLCWPHCSSRRLHVTFCMHAFNDAVSVQTIRHVMLRSCCDLVCPLSWHLNVAIEEKHNSSMKLRSRIIWDTSPCIPLKISQRFRRTRRLHLRPGSKEETVCLAHSTTLKMEATCSSEMFVDFQWTTRRYIPKDRIIHNHRCEVFMSY
jgi:hypothetical protein